MRRIFAEQKNPLLERYTTQATKREEKKGCWGVLDVEVFLDGQRIGGYERNYPSLMRTFWPFEVDGRHYALYSPRYTSTRVMRLPECDDIGGEGDTANGFCPVDYHVPCGVWIDIPQRDSHPKTPYVPQMGLVAGCVWGDDTSWKVQYLDLSRVTEGIIARDERFGYIELPNGMHLCDAADFDPEANRITIATALDFDLSSGKLCFWHREYLGLDKPEDEEDG